MRGSLPQPETKDLASTAVFFGAYRRNNSEPVNPSSSNLLWKGVLLSVICCFLLSGCRSRQANAGASIEFTVIPLADEGGPQRFGTIEGQVTGSRPGQQVVLYARSGDWYVQPYADQPFTKIRPDSTWSNSIHLGTDYAALLVEPDYRPPTETDVLPPSGGGVVAVSVVKGKPVFWRTWWFQLACVMAVIFSILVFYRFRLRRLTRQLNVRFEERLAERTRIAQELHDTLLQGFLSSSMLLHVAVDQLPTDSPAKPLFSRVQQLMGQVIEEGRQAVQGLRYNDGGSHNLEEAFSRVQQELAVHDEIGFRVIVEGRPQPLHPIIRDEVYRIGREALINAFRHAKAKSIRVEVEYSDKHLRVFVSDDGEGIDSQVLRSGREGHWGLSGMRERAERIGARLKVRSRATAGTEVELSVPGHIAFKSESSLSSPGWFARIGRRKAEERKPQRAGSEADK